MREEAKRAVTVGLAATTLGMVGTQVIRHDARAETKAKGRMNAARLPAGPVAIDSEWDLPETRNDRVDFFIEFLMGKRHDDTRLWMSRIGRYGPMIQQKLRERGMPQDLIFLTMIESGFDPNAHSRADAVGLWQFIAETGRRYGLEVSSDVDERRDPVKATDAALDYLQDLYDQFGSWYLAAAAYNTGENRVERILREQVDGRRGDDDLYWRISPYIPRETRDYVPLMLAAGHIAKEPQKYGFDAVDFQDPLRFDTVEVAPGTGLDAVARAAGVPEEQVSALNPHLIRERAPRDGAATVRVPPGRADAVVAALEGARRV